MFLRCVLCDSQGLTQLLSSSQNLVFRFQQLPLLPGSYFQVQKMCFLLRRGACCTQNMLISQTMKANLEQRSSSWRSIYIWPLLAVLVLTTSILSYWKCFCNHLLLNSYEIMGRYNLKGNVAKHLEKKCFPLGNKKSICFSAFLVFIVKVAFLQREHKFYVPYGRKTSVLSQSRIMESTELMLQNLISCGSLNISGSFQQIQYFLYQYHQTK